jgi:uncharacterized membrane protein YcaP (DUF421 family)
MFGLTFPVLVEKIIRPILIYIFLIVGLRLAGKRELAQLNPFDLVVLLTLSNAVQNAIIGNDSSVTGGIMGAATLLVINSFFVRFLHRHHKIERILEGDRDVLMKDGKILKHHLDRELMTRAELCAAARKQGLASLAEVERAVLEPTGTITFVAKTPTTDDIRHHELMDMIDALRKEVTALKPAPSTPDA